MNGRTEHELVFNKRIETMSGIMPEFIQEWIGNLDVGGKIGIDCKDRPILVGMCYSATCYSSPS